MKTIFKSILILLTITLYNCDNNDDMQNDPSNPTDGFTHNNTFFETANAYYEIDEDDDDNDSYPDNYSFFFTDGRMADGDVSTGAPVDADEYIFSLNTTHFVFFNLKIDANPSLASGPPIAGNTYYGDLYDATYNATPNTVIVENYTGSMVPFTPSYLINGVEYGNPSGDDDTNKQGPNNSAPSITINAINIDTNNPSLSSMDVDYMYTNYLGEVFTGHYEGSLGIILD